MAWLNSDDKYCPWTLRTVAEIFDAYPEIQWLTGLQGAWNDRGTLIEAANAFMNVHDYVAGHYEWIQQELSFWRRSLWERAGGRLDESYRLMIDGELWTRFFQYAEPVHALCVLGGYRHHVGNRGRLHQQDCHKEMARALADMRANLTAENLARVPQQYLTLMYDHRQSRWAIGRFMLEKPK